jgi:hypothetical protein
MTEISKSVLYIALFAELLVTWRTTFGVAAVVRVECILVLPNVGAKILVFCVPKIHPYFYCLDVVGLVHPPRLSRGRTIQQKPSTQGRRPSHVAIMYIPSDLMHKTDSAESYSPLAIIRRRGF